MYATGQEMSNFVTNRTGVDSWDLQIDAYRHFPEVGRHEEKRLAGYALRRDADERDNIALEED